MIDNGPQFKIHKYLRFAQEYGFTIVKSLLQPGKWESRVSSQNCQEHPKEISKRGSLSGSPRNTPQQGTETHLNRVTTHPSGSIPKSGV